MSNELLKIKEIANKYDALLFDLDGTLVNSIQVYKGGWLYSVKKFNINLDVQELKNFAGASNLTIAKYIINKYNLNTNADYILEQNKIYLDQNLIKNTKLLKLAELLKEYHNIKKIGLGTGSSNSIAYSLLNSFDIKKYFGKIVTSCDVLHEKPHPETWLILSNSLNVKPNRCLVFEDGDLGIKGALECGMSAYNVCRNELYVSVNQHKEALKKENICLY